MIIMKLIFNRDGSGFFPEYLKKRYEKELSCYQILKFEMGKLVSESSKSSVFVVGFSLRHRETGQSACFVFFPADMSYDILQMDFPCFAFTEGEEVDVKGKFIFGELTFNEDFASFDVCVPRFWHCENLTELKALMELYALLSEDKLLIDAVSTTELPKPVIWNSFATYAYFLNEEKALIVKDLEFLTGNNFALSLENRDPDSCFYIVDKKNLTFPSWKLYQQSNGKYVYFNGEVFNLRQGKHITEKEAISMIKDISKKYSNAYFWKRPLPYYHGWLVGVIRRFNVLIYLNVELYSGNVELIYPDELSFPADPDDKRFIYVD